MAVAAEAAMEVAVEAAAEAAVVQAAEPVRAARPSWDVGWDDARPRVESFREGNASWNLFFFFLYLHFC